MNLTPREKDKLLVAMAAMVARRQGAPISIQRANIAASASFIFGPGGMPRDLTARIRDEFARATRHPEVMEKWPGWGYEPVAGTP